MAYGLCLMAYVLWPLADGPWFVAFGLWHLPCALCPMLHARWQVGHGDGLCPMAYGLWAVADGLCLMPHALWFMPCGLYPWPWHMAYELWPLDFDFLM